MSRQEGEHYYCLENESLAQFKNQYANCVTVIAMTNLTVINQNGQLLVDSRDVAEMVDRSHNELMKSIRQYCDYLGQGNFAQSDFFIPSMYVNSQNKEQPDYLITRKDSYI